MLRQRTYVKTISTRLGHSSVSFTMDTDPDILTGMQKAAMGEVEDVGGVPSKNFRRG